MVQLGRDLRRAGAATPCLRQLALGSDQATRGFIQSQLGNCKEGGRTTSLENLVHCWAFPWRERSFVCLFLKPIQIPPCVLTAALILVFGRFEKCLFCHLFHGINKDVKEDELQDLSMCEVLELSQASRQSAA